MNDQLIVRERPADLGGNSYAMVVVFGAAVEKRWPSLLKLARPYVAFCDPFFPIKLLWIWGMTPGETRKTYLFKSQMFLTNLSGSRSVTVQQSWENISLTLHEIVFLNVFIFYIHNNLFYILTKFSILQDFNTEFVFLLQAISRGEDKESRGGILNTMLYFMFAKQC